MIARIDRSAVVATAPQAVWHAIRDFNGLPSWHPLVADSRVEEHLASDQVGCIRNYGRHDKLRIREQLLALDDLRHSCAYSLIDPPIPVRNYWARIDLLPVTETGHTFVRWTAEFECAHEMEQELTQGIGQVFALGLESLRKRFGQHA
jgi:hypothetical protein